MQQEMARVIAFKRVYFCQGIIYMDTDFFQNLLTYLLKIGKLLFEQPFAHRVAVAGL